MPRRQHRHVTIDDVRDAEFLFNRLRQQGEHWVDAEREVAGYLGIHRSTWGRWRARLRRNDAQWFAAPFRVPEPAPPPMSVQELLDELNAP
jgi:hypothetical protein